MNILFFSPYFFPYLSGLTLYPYRLLSALSKKNNITVLTFLHEANISSFEKIKKLTIKRMPYCFKISKGYISILSLFVFLKECLKNEVIILNLPNVEGLGLAFIAFLCRKKIITIYHCRIKLQGITGFFLQNIINLTTYIQLILSKNIISHDDYAKHTLPSYFHHKLIHAYPMRDQILRPKIKIKNKLMQEKNNDIWIGFAGRIASEKGIEFLIDAVYQLYQKNKNVRLILLGPHPTKTAGEKTYRDFIMNKINTYSLPVKRYYDLNSSYFYAVLQVLDVLVVPSVNQTEAFNLTQIEAMTLGTPVVATHIYGVRIPILKTGMGILVKPKQAGQIEKAISSILKNRAIYTNQKLIQKAVDEFNPIQTLKTFERLIKK